ncbi:hypothetical protein PRZ48_014251 [Zasmidium cellare]|uniref:Peptidase A1 domain-containing protein n=1 Tax=Zasmidium cellare TaxID=395010 RepID=A0ABR0E0F3_ZASCE|nr:hypothetical protein PRZ48_014251 [Zasmidium cellare]
MHGVLQLALTALSATVALAAPAPSSKNGLAKRSFKAQTNGRGLAKNPIDEINLTHRKYGWEIIIINPEAATSSTLTLEPPAPFTTSSYGGQSTSAPSSSSPTYTPSAPYGYGNGTQTAGSASPTGTGTGSEDGVVSANPEENEKEYLSPVTIGGQKLNLNFDTGSADLWVFSNKLTKQEIGEHSIYDESKSSTWQLLDGATWNITYGDGSGASGIVGYDTVDVGGSTVDKQAVELATQISDQFESDLNMDGLLGLAFTAINTVEPQPQKTFFENLLPDLSSPVFTADLEEVGGKGTYEFGTINKTKYSGDIHYVSVDASNGFWEFEIPSFEIAGKKIACTTCSTAIADTGTSLVYLDEDIVDEYFSQVKSAQYSSLYGTLVYDCSETLPDLGIQFGSYVATIKGKEMEYAEIEGGVCMAGLQPGPGNMQILGDVLLKQFFAVFDGKEGAPQFGIAEKDTQ